MSEAHAQFGADCFKLVQSVPFGSLTKRELELGLLRAGIDAGLLSEESAALAASLGLSLTKANAYLTDLALRQPPLADVDAVKVLIETLQTCEVVVNANIVCPFEGAAEILDYFGGSSCIPTNSVGSPSSYVANMMGEHPP